MNQQTMMAMYHVLITITPHYQVIGHQVYESLTFTLGRVAERCHVPAGR